MLTNSINCMNTTMKTQVYNELFRKLSLLIDEATKNIRITQDFHTAETHLGLYEDLLEKCIESSEKLRCLISTRAQSVAR